MIALIVAKATNNVIGNHNDLPWYLPADLKHFKEITIGHPVVMGRKTFESIYNRLKGPLPNRRNIVVTTSLTDLPEGFEYATSLESAFALADTADTIFVIGGATIYKECLDQNLVDEIYMTEIEAEIPGDTYFPKLHTNNWQKVSQEPHQRDEKNPYDYDFVIMRKK